MSPVRGLKRISPRIWIPPVYGALWKLEVTRLDETTTDDITDIIFSGEIIDGVTDTIGNFEFSVDNSSESLTDAWSGGETFIMYNDYATSSTTARFRGIIEKVSYRDQRIKITGRSVSSKLLGITVTKAFTEVETSVVLKELFDIYAPNFTYANVDTSTTNITVNWYQKPFWECVQELCKSAGFDAYIDVNLDCNYFESGSRNNTTDAVVHESNLFEVGDFAFDQSLLKNRVIVYGADIGGLPLIKSSEDTTSQDTYGIKELIIQDQNITTESQAQEKADYELSLAKDPPLVGDVVSIGLATVQPGENVNVSAPLSNLDPKYYKIVSYKHKFEGFMKTILTIEKEPKKIYHVMRDRISNEQKLADTPNPNEMRFTWNFDFSSDSGTHSNTQIVDGVLKTISGASGTWISETNPFGENVGSVELRANGSTIPGTSFSISADGGITYQSIGLNTSLNLSPPGPTLRIKIELNSASTEITSLALLYKR